MADQKKVDPVVQKIQESKFLQQELKVWRPQFTTQRTLLTFLLLGALLMTGGYLMKTASDQTYDYPVEYDEWCKDTFQDKNKKCELQITVDQKVPGPVYVYYQIDNMYQNHRSYVKSRSNLQHLGKYFDVAELSDCDPVIQVKDLWEHQKQNLNNQKLEDDAPAIPCGLVSKSFFNDTFKFKTQPDDSKDPIVIQDKGIAWETDVKYKFKNIEEDQLPEGKASYKDVQWQDMTDERYIVWMRAAGLPNFRKLWGRIDEGLDKGSYTIEIDNQYNVKPFKGKKYFVLATTNYLGGKNYLLAYFHYALGGICFAFCLFLLFDQHKERKNKSSNTDDKYSKQK